MNVEVTNTPPAEAQPMAEAQTRQTRPTPKAEQAPAPEQMNQAPEAQTPDKKIIMPPPQEIEAANLNSGAEPNLPTEQAKTEPETSQIPDSITLGNRPNIGENVTFAAGEETTVKNNVTIGDNTTIGEGVDIGHRSRIGVELSQDAATGITQAETETLPEGATIGDNVTIGNKVEVGKGAEIGDDVIIDNRAVIAPEVRIGGGNRVAPDQYVAEDIPSQEGYAPLAPHEEAPISDTDPNSNPTEGETAAPPNTENPAQNPPATSPTQGGNGAADAPQATTPGQGGNGVDENEPVITEVPAPPGYGDTPLDGPYTPEVPEAPIETITPQVIVDGQTYDVPALSNDPDTRLMQESAILSDAAYYLDHNKATQNPERGMFNEDAPPELIASAAHYEFTPLYNENGDHVYGAENIDTRDLFVVTRGTDNIWEDGQQYWNVTVRGDVTDSGARTAESAIAFSEMNDGKPVTLTGHSLGGHAAEVAGRILPQEMVENVVNVQGPSIQDRGPFGGKTPLGKTEQHPNTFRITSDDHPGKGQTSVQKTLDYLGTDGPAPAEVRVPIAEHATGPIREYFNDMAYYGETVEIVPDWVERGDVKWPGKDD